MPLDVAYYEELHPLLVEELRATFTDESELEVIDDIASYNLFTLLLNGLEVHGLAAIRVGSSRLMCDVSVRTGRNSTKRTEMIVDALAKLTNENPIVIEWWSRGPSLRSAKAVAKARSLPQYRRIFRMERHLPTLAGEISAPTLSVRSFKANDADDVVALNNAAFVDHPDQFDFSTEKLFKVIDNTSKAQDLLLTDVDGELAGFIWTRPSARNQFGELYVLAVHPRFQGRGLGSALLEVGVAHLYKRHATRTAILYVDASDKQSVAMYKRHGFFDTKQDLISFLV